MAAMRAAKERKRLARVDAEPAREHLAGRHCYTFTLHDRTAGTMHTLDFYVSDKRINAYRVTVDGKPWKDAISMTRVLAAVRKKLPPYRKIE